MPRSPAAATKSVPALQPLPITGAVQQPVVGSCLPVAGHKRNPRLGKARTGGRRSCTFMVLFLLAATLLMVDVVQAVFTPENTDALKAAVGSCSCSNCDGSNPTFSCAAGGCLGENMTGYCPTFAATTEATTGNPYGVMGDWDVSKVQYMVKSTSTSVPHCLFIGWCH